MRQLARVLITGVLAVASFSCEAESICSELAVQSHVEAAKGALSLADLLTHGTCSRFQQAASQISLGAAPRAGSVRVLEGREVRQLLAGLAIENKNENENAIENPSKKPESAVRIKIPDRIVIQRAAATKSCREIAGFVAGAVSLPDTASPPFTSWQRTSWQKELNCSGAPGIPEDTPLELTKSVWNTALLRWEFTLRCAQPADCVPFLVWTRERKISGAAAFEKLHRAPEPGPRGLQGAAQASTSAAGRMVKPGQTVTLSWQQGGIRVVLPVTCLDAGGMGQFVRVRFKNAPGILRAQVVGAGILQANL
ncbi:MAG: flagella basal body P-ring formation protein FlgA [Acidobacteriaceae bacterium]